jgi:hypothetical protein
LQGGGPGFESPRLHPGGPCVIFSISVPLLSLLHLDNAPRETRWVWRPWMWAGPEGRAGSSTRTAWKRSSNKENEARVLSCRGQNLNRETQNQVKPRLVSDNGGFVLALARAGLVFLKKETWSGESVRNRDVVRRPEDGRRVDALAMAAEEGRGHAAKCPGEALAA